MNVHFNRGITDLVLQVSQGSVSKDPVLQVSPDQVVQVSPDLVLQVKQDAILQVKQAQVLQGRQDPVLQGSSDPVQMFSGKAISLVNQIQITWVSQYLLLTQNHLVWKEHIQKKETETPKLKLSTIPEYADAADDDVFDSSFSGLFRSSTVADGKSAPGSSNNFLDDSSDKIVIDSNPSSLNNSVVDLLDVSDSKNQLSKMDPIVEPLVFQNIIRKRGRPKLSREGRKTP